MYFPMGQELETEGPESDLWDLWSTVRITSFPDERIDVFEQELRKLRMSYAIDTLSQQDYRVYAWSGRAKVFGDEHRSIRITYDRHDGGNMGSIPLSLKIELGGTVYQNLPNSVFSIDCY